MAAVDIGELEANVRQMYRQVADQPDGPFTSKWAEHHVRVAGLAIADIVTRRQLTEAIASNADLRASCIGGAAQKDASLKPHRGHRPEDRGHAGDPVRVPVHPRPQRRHQIRGAKQQRTCDQTGPLSRNPSVNNRRETQ